MKQTEQRFKAVLPHAVYICMYCNKLCFEVEYYQPLNVITLDQTKNDNSNQMITIIGDFYLVICIKSL